MFLKLLNSMITFPKQTNMAKMKNFSVDNVGYIYKNILWQILKQ